MARLSTLSDSEDVKPDVSRSAQAKGKRKRGPAPGAEHDSGGYASSLSPQAAKEKKPRIKKEPGSAPAKPSAWSKAQVRQLWDALDMKPVSLGALRAVRAGDVVRWSMVGLR